MGGVDKLGNLTTLTVSGGRLNVYGAMKELRDLLQVPEGNEVGSIYPNPSRVGEMLNVKVTLPFPTDLRIDVIDELGRRHFEGSLKGAYIGDQLLEIPWKANHAGIYFVRFRSAEHSTVRMIFVK